MSAGRRERAHSRGRGCRGQRGPELSRVFTVFFPSPLSLDPGHLKESEHPSMWGPVELVGIIAGPVFLLFLIIIIVFLVINYHQRVYHNRQRLDMEDPSCEMCLSKDKTLQDLVYDLSTSGSGSGTESFSNCVCRWSSSPFPSRDRPFTEKAGPCTCFCRHQGVWFLDTPSFGV